MTQARVSQILVEALIQDPNPEVRVPILQVEVLQSVALEMPEPPPAPENPAAEATSSSEITVTWEDVEGETGYRVERRPC